MSFVKSRVDSTRLLLKLKTVISYWNLSEEMELKKHFLEHSISKFKFDNLAIEPNCKEIFGINIKDAALCYSISKMQPCDYMHCCRLDA